MLSSYTPGGKAQAVLSILSAGPVRFAVLSEAISPNTRNRTSKLWHLLKAMVADELILIDLGIYYIRPKGELLLADLRAAVQARSAG